MRSGFILLEIIIAIALGSMIGASLFTSFFQVNNAYKVADRIIDVDMRACTVQNQLERDISGVFVPAVFIKQKETKTTTKKTVIKGDKKTVSTKKEKEKEKKEEPLEKAFYAQNKEGKFSFLSCVTSNPLQVYGEAKPRVARVLYQLVEQAGNLRGPKSYKLVRQESLNLNFKVPQKEKDAKGYELSRNIKSISAEYIVIPQKKEKNAKEGQKKEPSKEKSDYKIFKQWGPEQIKKANRNIPHFVNITISFWDRSKKKAKKFIFKMLIAAQDLSSDGLQKSSKTQSQSPKKEDKSLEKKKTNVKKKTSKKSVKKGEK